MEVQTNANAILEATTFLRAVSYKARNKRKHPPKKVKRNDNDGSKGFVNRRPAARIR